jgi:LysM repeat protein
MIAPSDDPTRSPHAIDHGPAGLDLSDADAAVHATREICPYLTARDGSWRSAAPHRDHRCGAVDPPGLLPIDKQRRLCLSVEHGSCAAFRAARAGRAAVLAPGLDPTAVAVADASRRPLARTAAVVLERPRFGGITSRWPLDRAWSQIALVVLMILAFGAVAVSRFSESGQSAAVVPTPSATAAATATPRPTPSPSPSPVASAQPSGLLAPSGSAAVPSAAPASGAPSFRATYRVKAGDTLDAISRQFGTTVKAIQEANGLTSTDLKIGQVLNIP